MATLAKKCYKKGVFIINLISIEWFKIRFYSSLECLETDHVADGHCDDIANTEICNWDGGDCCGPNRVVDYCTECQCHENTTLTTAASTQSKELRQFTFY